MLGFKATPLAIAGLAVTLSLIGCPGLLGQETPRVEAVSSASNVFVFEIDGNDNDGAVVETTGHLEDGHLLLELKAGHDISLPIGERGYLGVHVIEISDDLRLHFGVEPGSGVLVSRVVAESPAARSGVAVGDILVRLDGQPVVSTWDLKRLIAPRSEGSVATLQIAREGILKQLEVTLEGRMSRTLDLAPLIRTDAQGSMVLVAPRVRFDGDNQHPITWNGTVDSETSVHLGQAYEGAIEALRSRELNEVVGEEVETRRAIEARIELLESRLREIEEELKQEAPP